MESKSTEQVNMDLPPYRAFPKLVDTRKKWTMGVSVAVFLVMIIVAGTLVGVYMTQKHTEQIWKQETSPRAAKRPCRVVSLYPPSGEVLDTALSRLPDVINAEVLLFPTKEINRMSLDCLNTNLVEVYVGPRRFCRNCEVAEEISLLVGRERCDANPRNKRHALGGDSSTTDGESGQPEGKPNGQCVAETKNLTDLVGKKANIIISDWVLDLTSTNADDFRKIFKKLLDLLKSGGRIFLVGGINAVFYDTNKEILDLLSYNEDFVREVMNEQGLEVIYFKIYQGNSNPNVVDYDGYYILEAVKPN